jgi:hypothetical protein
MTEPRSPLREPPLHNPGQSANNQLLDLLLDKVVFWIILVAMFFAFTVAEWAHWIGKTPPQPFLMTGLTVVFAAFVGYRTHKVFPLLRRYKQGRDGEIAVGQMLEGLRKDGYEVFHDIPSPRGNVDHVLVGPGGVFVIETKTRAKPTGDAKVVYDGKQITVNGQVPDRDPVAQVRAAASQVEELIQRGVTGKIPIRPVLLYVRWYTEQPKGSDIWVINEKTLMKWVRTNYKKLSPDQVRQAAMCLDLYVRNYRES